MQYNLSYWQDHDRLALTIQSGDQQSGTFLLTRRLTNRMLNGLSALMAKEGVAAPTDDSAESRRDEILNFEHATAIEQSRLSGQTKTAKTLVQDRDTLADNLVLRVDIQRFANGAYQIAFITKLKKLEFSLSKYDLHVFVDTLVSLTQTAEWDLQINAAWLRPAQRAASDRSKFGLH